MKGCIQLLNVKFASLVIIHVSNNNFFLEFFFEYPYYLPGPVVYPITFQIEISKYLENILSRGQWIEMAIKEIDEISSGRRQI